MLCKPQDSLNPWIDLWGRVNSSDRSSAYAVDKANQLFNTIRRLDELIRAQADSLIRRINAQFGTTIDNLNLSLHYDGQQFNVIETQTRTGLWQGKI